METIHNNRHLVGWDSMRISNEKDRARQQDISCVALFIALAFTLFAVYDWLG